jgi:hypothetical protein
LHRWVCLPLRIPDTKGMVRGRAALWAVCNSQQDSQQLECSYPALNAAMNTLTCLTVRTSRLLCPCDLVARCCGSLLNPTHQHTCAHTHSHTRSLSNIHAQQHMATCTPCLHAGSMLLSTAPILLGGSCTSGCRPPGATPFLVPVTFPSPSSSPPF